jgi:ParB family chromosome partitioning protein
MVRKGLGRGLSTLLGEKQGGYAVFSSDPEPVSVMEMGGAAPTEVLLDRIEPNPYQPRLEMDPEALEELSQSIRTHGLLEPLLVRRSPANSMRYQLIAGERRLRASHLAGLDRVPVIVHEASDEEMLEIALVENVQRENLNPIDEARGYRLLLEGAAAGGVGLTQQEVADRVGKNRASVANLLRLLDLPDYVQVSIQSGTLSQGHGKVLAGLEEPFCREAWEYANRTQASVRGLEEFVKKTQKPLTPTVSKPKTDRTPAEPLSDPHWVSIQEALQERLRTKVFLRRNKDDSGVIEIQFFNAEDLDRLLETLDIEM